MNLSKIQSNIVTSPIGEAIQVLASAGTGKTRVLTERVRYILQNTKKDRVIALTFTNKAAEEMKTRLTDCDEIEDRTWIATIHSVAQRVLEKYSHTIGLPNELHIYEKDQDRMEVFLQSLRDDGFDIDKYLTVNDTRELKNREKKLQYLMDIFSKIKRELLTKEDILKEDKDDSIWEMYKDYQKALLDSGGIDYDDILVYAHKILLNQEWVAKIYRTQYKHICVDEAQDLNKVQYEFIKTLCGTGIKSILMVGDPNQMIYGFNGSSNIYLSSQFLQDFNPQQFELKENYRSTKAVVRVANKLKSNSQIENEYALEGRSSVKECDSEEDEAQYIVDEINKLIALKQHEEIEGEINLERIVVIARNRFVFNTLEKKLKENEIPFYLKKGEQQMEPVSKFGKVLDYAIRVKLNHKDWVDGTKLCQLLNLSIPDVWDENILASIVESVSENESLMKKLLKDVENLDIDSPNIPKFVNGLKIELENRGKEEKDSLEAIKLSLEELNEFNNCWTRFKSQGLGETLGAFRNALALGQLSNNNHNKGLTLSTVHTMKGLEKDIVFLIGMCEGVFPDYRAQSKKEINEERNNAFVAVTRAKRWLYITYPTQRKMPWGDIRSQTVSRFITEILKQPTPPTNNVG